MLNDQIEIVRQLMLIEHERGREIAIDQIWDLVDYIKEIDDVTTNREVLESLLMYAELPDDERTELLNSDDSYDNQ